MEAERWKRIRQLFDAAVDLEPGEREPFVVRSCGGDSALVEEVLSLLEQDHTSDAPIRDAVRESKMRAGGLSLAAGEHLGTYEVTGVIGVGGMGEVYRARDTSLDRDVAIKIIPQAFASDPTRLSRFQREAKVLAALSHPNIASIYGLEKRGDAPALVLELVPGNTLAELVAEGPVPLEQALLLARQLAEALDAAHEQGIVHRDLKPANIKVTRHGIVKVLDFGLAKLLEDKGADADSSSSLLSMTDAGTGAVLGTAAYMSPEQARGEPVDKRTDVWAFGAVVYEMLTGCRLFAGESVSDTLAAVLRDEVVFTSLPPDTPLAVTRLLRRCLERDPKRRVRDIGDAWLEIDDAIESPSGKLALRDPPEQGVAARHREGPWFFAVAAVCIAGLAAWHFSRTGPARSSPPSRFAVSVPQGVSIARAADHLSGGMVALSPDGRTIAFTATRNDDRQIYLRALDQLEAQPLVGTEGGRTPVFSPDGDWVAFFADTTEDVALKKVPVAGGDPVTLCEGAFDSAHWGADDRIVLGSRSGLQVVRASGGTPAPLLELAEPEWHRGPHLLPGGNAVLFYVWTGSPDTAHTDVVHLQTGERRRLVQGTSPRFVAGGHLVFARAGSLWAAPFDPGSLALEGEPIRVVDELDINLRGFASYDLADNGALLYAHIAGVPERALLWVDMDGNETLIDAPLRGYNFPRLSPDGTRLAVSLGQVDPDVWIYDIARSLLTRFTVHPSSDSDAEWSPDGSHIAFHSHRDGAGHIYLRAADGSGDITRITSGSGEKLVTSWAPDGRSLLFSELRRGSNRALFRMDLAGSNGSSELMRTSANLSAATLSPDGRWLAYVSDESGGTEVYVRPYPDVERARWQVSSGGGRSPLWSLDGQEIFFRRGAEMRRVSFHADSGVVIGKPETLFEGPYVVGGDATYRSYDLAPDGRFLMVKDAASDRVHASSSRLILVQNWTEELQGLFR